jgi:hypothetical protein
MKSILLALLATLLLSNNGSAAAALNTLTEDQKTKGWRLLFNGKDLDGWRTYKKDGEIGAAWQVKDGILHKVGGAKGGDVMTVETFGDFDLNWEWRIEKRGNSGIKYCILEKRKATIGHEYQMLDDANYGNGKGKAKGLTASFYDVLPPVEGTKPLEPGAWNHSRIFVLGSTVEHWLNGEKVLEYELGSEAVLKAVQNSKFKKHAKFGTKVSGHILLTDHRDPCQFKNIRIREFK